MKTKKKKRLTTLARKGRSIRQVGALPYRRAEDGSLAFLLVTSRETGRFIIPKGWPMKNRSASRAAAIEAREEAGVVGRTGPLLGSFSYWKRLKKVFVPIMVDVYALAVTDEHDDWKERQSRRRAWLSAEQAARLVDEPELVSLLKDAEVLVP
jgi:8-oxo-dGTP pyrophosphatase MutT (NUDIX family)